MTSSWQREDTMLGIFQSSAEAVRRARAFQARPPASDGVEMAPVPTNNHHGAGSGHQFQQFPGSLFRRGGILAGHEMAVHQHEGAPIGTFFIKPAVRLEHVFYQKRHHRGEPHGLFLGVGETGHAATAYQRLAACAQGVFENRRRVADRADGAVARCEGFDQPLAVLAFRQIPQRSVAARIEDGVVFIGIDFAQRDGGCQGLPRRRRPP